MAKTRRDFINARGETDPEQYAKNVKLAREVANVLRKNVVQGRLQDHGTYSMRLLVLALVPDGLLTLYFLCPGLRITKDTELGSNETIKSPAPMEIRPRSRKRCSDSSLV